MPRLIPCSCRYDAHVTAVILPDPWCRAHCTCIPEVTDPECKRCLK